jgi:hypothetical protein
LGPEGDEFTDGFLVVHFVSFSYGQNRSALYTLIILG